MRKGQSIKVFAELRDLEIFDSEGTLCGVADDVEFEGSPGARLRIVALLAGPGAYRDRVPGWLLAIVRRVAGDRIARVGWSQVEHVTSRITLNCTAEQAGLGVVDRRLRPLIAKVPFS